MGGARVTDRVKDPSRRPRAERESEQGVHWHKTSMSFARRLVVPALASAPIPLTDRSILRLNGHTAERFHDGSLRLNHRRTWLASLALVQEKRRARESITGAGRLGTVQPTVAAEPESVPDLGPVPAAT